MKKYIQYAVLLFCVVTFAQNSFSQMMNDGIFMAKGSLCGGITYSNSSWKNYWEGTLFRENKNLGTVTTQSINLSANYGITNRLNILATLPYITIKPSAGVLHGMSGIQDLTLAVKCVAIQTKNLSVIGSIGGSIPTNNYVADYMPLAIGVQSKTAFGRGILYYTLPVNLAFTVHGTYTARTNVKVDREMYYSDKAYFTNEMMMLNVVNFGAKFGHYSYRWQLEAAYDQQITGGNIDIRRNDLPGICNKFDYTKVGFVAAYRIPQLKDIQLMITGGKILTGRNVGESTIFSIGISQFIDFRKNKTIGAPSGAICRPGDNMKREVGGEMKTGNHK